MNVPHRWMLAVGLALLVHALMVPFFPKPVAAESPLPTRASVHLLRLKIVPKRHYKRLKKIHHVLIKQHALHVVHVLALPGAKAHGKPHHTRIIHRAAAPKRIVMHRELARPLAKPVVVAKIVPTPDVVIGSGTTGSDRVAPADGGGDAGNADAGSGAADHGAGSGEGTIPCGNPEFDMLPVNARQHNILSIDAETSTPMPVQHAIRVIVRFPDGSVQNDVFPYLWVYPNHEDDPFDRRNRNNTRINTLLQFPPSGFDRSTLSPLLRYVLKRTSSEGLSILLPCPGDPQ